MMRFFFILLFIVLGGFSASGAIRPAADSLRFPIREGTDRDIRTDIPPSPLFMSPPSNVTDSVVYDPVTKRYIFMKLVGGKYNYSRPYSITLDEYVRSQNRLSLYEYNRRQRQEGDQYDFKELVSQLQFLDKILSPIFGVNQVRINVQGSVELTLGAKTSKVDNPTLPVDLRKTTTLDFDEKIQFNINGNIGDLINLEWSYNTDATFDFENMLKLHYEGKEDNIIKKVEAGNVSLPLPGTLITGGQNLWGFRTDLQFGKLSVSSIFTQQKSESSVIHLDKGAQKQEFELSAHNYEANRHFFLSNYFRKHYDEALAKLPIINSGVTITKIEVWVTNKVSNFEQARNIVAFTDLGEIAGDISNTAVVQGLGGSYPDNRRNTLYGQLDAAPLNAIRDINQVTTTFSTYLPGFLSAWDYEKIENARLLDPSEYVLNAQLGYISLNQALNTDEVLAVAYEYTVRGELFTVGELTSNAHAAPSALYVKMLRSTTQSPAMPTWNLMMKNIYNIGSYNLKPDDFVLDILYQNDKAGTKVNYVPAGKIKDKILLSVLNLDRLNSQQDATPDGRFDYVEGITVFPSRGRIAFPVLEPFGSYLRTKIDDPSAGEYVFEELYTMTQSDAEKNAEKNKFYLKGNYQSSSSSEISLGGGDVPQGSVKVLAGGVELTENIDYIVEYTMGVVRIINQALLESGTPITVKSENRDILGMQTRSLVGAHFNYQFNEKFSLGATIMHMNEKPFTHKVNIGEEPISNTIWGLNASYNTESGFLTTLVDKLPFVNTKVKSRLNIDAEFAQFKPGVNKGAGGNAYIDDFEGSKMSYDMKSVTQWKLASTPQDDEFPEGKLTDDHASGFNRARMTWYVVDPLFYRMSSATPGHIRTDREQRSNHFVREIRQTELFPNKDLAVGDVNIVPALSLAYYPKEKGAYNFDALPGSYSGGLNADGTLNDPASRWGGMIRSVQTNDFEAANVQYIEMWMLDPFVYEPDHKGGDLYLDLGNISEDILRDGRKSFENGLPVSATVVNVDSTEWGRIPTVQAVVNGFDNNSQSRRFQDVGLDGLNDEEERTYFAAYLAELRNRFGENSEVYRRAWNDPAGDNYHYFRGSDFDAQETPILERYKRYNGTEGNSPTTDMSPESYATAATNLPDVEDINNDNTLNETESFFRYKLSLRPEDMRIGHNFITDIQTAAVELPNGTTEEVKWYQVRIPLNAADRRSYGEINDFKSIRFMRMVMKGFQDSIILRLASLDLVRDNWRKFEGKVDGQLAGSDQAVFDVSVVNLEENASKEPVNYVMPPGIQRVVDATNPQLRVLNEQAMLLKVINLEEGDAKAVYRNMFYDMLRYKTLLMDVHAEAIEGYPVANEELTLFLRLGNDHLNNYYEYEIPLALTPPGFYMDDEQGRLGVWPAVNKVALPLQLLQKIKQQRSAGARQEGTEVNLTEVFERTVAELGEVSNSDMMKHIVKIKGKPSLAEIRSVLIGVRNPESASGGKGERSAEVWVNELRLSDFDTKGGWAANVRMTAKLADIATVTFAGSRMTPGFGSIEQRASQIAREDFRSLDFSTSVEFGKFFPEKWRVRLPMYYAYSRQTTLPEYDPLDTDVPLDLALDNAESAHVRDSIRRSAEDYTERRSLNFTNIGIASKDGKSRLLDISNLNLTFSYNKVFSRNVNTERDLDKNYRGLLSYVYNGMPNLVEPFKNSQSLRSPYLRILKDFNFYYLPSMVSFTSDITRTYREIKLRNLDNPDMLIEPTVDKNFMWNRDYALKFNLTKNLSLDFLASAQSRIDEPEGIVDRNRDPDRYQEWKDTVWHNILDGGRPVNYHQDLNIRYRVPVDKLPGLNWIGVETMYGTNYDWQAGALTDDSTRHGNVIRNRNTLQLSGNFSLSSLYNKSKLIRDLLSNRPRRNGKTVNFDTEVERVRKGRSFTINHKLKTSDIRVRLQSSTGEQLNAGFETIGKNKVRVTPSQDMEVAKVLITGTENPAGSGVRAVGRFLLGIVTGLKDINISYAEDRGTTLPGFLPEARWLGQQRYNGSSAPGFSFLFGGQSKNFGLRAAEKGWVTTDTTLNSPYLMDYTQNIYLRARFEPVKKLQINLTANRMRSRNSSEYLVYDGEHFSSMNAVQTGSLSMTTMALKSAFFKVGNNVGSSAKVYEEFLEHRKAVSEQMAQERYGETYQEHALEEEGKQTGFYEGYGPTSQEVLISAFNRAYGVGEYSGLIPKILMMRPNWRLAYTGMMDIPFMKKVFKSFSLNHAYTCKYTIGSYSSNLKYEEQDGLASIRDMQGNWMAKFDVNTVSLNEQFNPLISMDMVWINDLTTRFDINRQRNVNLNLVNAQVSETSSNELVVGVGYRFANLPMFLNSKKLDNSINVQCDYSLRRNNTIIRRISEAVDQLTAGQEVQTIKLSADYTFNNRLNLRLFYDRVVNTPYVSLSFPTTNTNFGLSVRYTLTQ